MSANFAMQDIEFSSGINILLARNIDAGHFWARTLQECLIMSGIKQNPNHPLVFVNDFDSLHHQDIDIKLNDSVDRQVFIYGQNPIVFDMLEFDSAEQVRKTFLMCSREAQNFVIKNMTKREADSFFQAYEVGIQHVSSILRANGLW